MIKNKKDEISILFDDIRDNDDIDKESYSIYLEEIYKDLAEPDENRNEVLFYNRFSDMIAQCPIFLALKFFNTFLSKEDQLRLYLTQKEFLVGLVTFRFGSFEDVSRIIFNIFDFNLDGEVIPEDVKLVISYLPLKVNKQKTEYLYQMESLSELDELICVTFKDFQKITFNDFIKLTDLKADIFLMVFCFLNSIIPKLDKNIVLKKRKTSEASNDSISSDNIVQSSGSSSKSVKKLNFTPLLFSPIAELNSKIRIKSSEKKKLQKFLENLGKNQNVSNIIEIEETKHLDKPIMKSLKAEGVTLIELNKIIDDENFDISLISTNDQFFTPTSFLKNEKTNIEDLKNLFSKTTILECNKEESNSDIFETISQQVENNNEIKKDSNEFDLVNEKEINETIIHEGELIQFIKVDGELSINYCYVILIGKSIYFYKDNHQEKEDYYDRQYLPGCFFKEFEQEEIGLNYFYSFSIVSPIGNKRFYHKEKECIKLWIKHLRAALNYQNFFEFYIIGETIGKGQYGVIKEGFDLKSKEKVAIKILNKPRINKLDKLNLMRVEVAIMKHCKHPNIIKFIANYENSEYIFIVMELLKHGTLKDYLEQNKYNINEKMAANIIYQISDALLYLHKYGIIHRDLKPSNILVKIVKDNLNKESSNVIEVKLADFGLSKILGNKEMTNEGYGTIAFASPEILLKHPYNYKVDVWSLGIIVYYLLSGDIPFAQDSKKLGDLTLNICSKDIQFSKKFKNISKEAISLIKSCLKKNQDNRISIEEIVNHKWFLDNK